MARGNIKGKAQNGWIKIYLNGCMQEPVRGLCCEHNLQGYGTEHFFYVKATIIGYREVNVETCEEDMNSRVRHWALYFDYKETMKQVEPPKPYATVEEILDIYGKKGNNNACSPYYKHYYLYKGTLIGIFATKKKAKQVAERMLEQRRLWVEQRLQAVSELSQMSIDADDKELPFD